MHDRVSGTIFADRYYATLGFIIKGFFAIIVVKIENTDTPFRQAHHDSRIPTERSKSDSPNRGTCFSEIFILV